MHSCQVTFLALDGQRWPSELGVGTGNMLTLISLPVPALLPPLPMPTYGWV